MITELESLMYIIKVRPKRLHAKVKDYHSTEFVALLRERISCVLVRRLKYNTDTIGYIENRDEIFESYKKVHKTVDDPSYELYLRAVKQNGNVLRYIDEQTYELCLTAVKQDGNALQFVKEQTYEICLEAVRQNGLALRYVGEQTYEICLEAVKQYGRALRYVKEQTYGICLEAVKQDGRALRHVKEQTFELCLEAINNNGYWIYIEDKNHRKRVREYLGLF